MGGSAATGPDAVAATREQGLQGRWLAREQTIANRPNQYNPWGSTEWVRSPQRNTGNSSGTEPAQWQDIMGGGGSKWYQNPQYAQQPQTSAPSTPSTPSNPSTSTGGNFDDIYGPPDGYDPSAGYRPFDPNDPSSFQSGDPNGDFGNNPTRPDLSEGLNGGMMTPEQMNAQAMRSSKPVDWGSPLTDPYGGNMGPFPADDPRAAEGYTGSTGGTGGYDVHPDHPDYNKYRDPNNPEYNQGVVDWFDQNPDGIFGPDAEPDAPFGRDEDGAPITDIGDPLAGREGDHITGGSGGSGGGGGSGSDYSHSNMPAAEEWNQIERLNPQLQASLDAQFETQKNRTEAAAALSQQLRGMGNFDFGQYGDPLAFDPTEQRQKAEDASYQRSTSRLDPQFEKQRNDLEMQLRNRGLRAGDQQFDDAMATFGRGRNDAYEQARTGSVQQGQSEAALAQQQNQYANQLRTQNMQEDLFARGYTLDQINALMQGQEIEGSTPSMDDKATIADTLLG